MGSGMKTPRGKTLTSASAAIGLDGGCAFQNGTGWGVWNTSWMISVVCVCIKTDNYNQKSVLEAWSVKRVSLFQFGKETKIAGGKLFWWGIHWRVEEKKRVIFLTDT